MFDEKEDDRRENLRQGGADQPAETYTTQLRISEFQARRSEELHTEYQGAGTRNQRDELRLL